MKRIASIGWLALAVYASGAAWAQSSPAQALNGVLTGPQKMTLYTFDKDVAGSGKSVCNGPCATNWPPLMAAEGASPQGDFSVIARDDGQKQWTFKGKPLYHWIKDAQPGDATGDGVNGVWHAARP